MGEQKILLSWSGLGREPYTFRAGRSVPGAHLQLLRDSDYAGFFDRHFLLAVPETLEDCERLLNELVALPKPVITELTVLRMSDPTDHVQIAHALSGFFEQANSTHRLLGQELFVLLNTGTPQMQTVWFMLKTHRILDFQIIQTTPQSLASASGTQVARKVDFDVDGLSTLFRPSREFQEDA